MKKIRIFGTETCPWCDKAKEYFDEKKVDYEYIDVGEDRKAAQEMIEKSGEMGVPQIEINGKMIVGFNKPAIEAELKKVKNA